MSIFRSPFTSPFPMGPSAGGFTGGGLSIGTGPCPPRESPERRYTGSLMSSLPSPFTSPLPTGTPPASNAAFKESPMAITRSLETPAGVNPSWPPYLQGEVEPSTVDTEIVSRRRFERHEDLCPGPRATRPRRRRGNTPPDRTDRCRRCARGTRRAGGGSARLGGDGLDLAAGPTERQAVDAREEVAAAPLDDLHGLPGVNDTEHGVCG